MTPTSRPKLPLWRLIAGIGVLGAFATIVGFLTPVYVDDLRLHSYVVSLEKAPDPGPAADETVRTEVLTRAHELDLPVKPNDIQLVHTNGKLKIDMRYVVDVNLVLYPVDLHFPTIR
jgi:hypothetical protein